VTQRDSIPPAPAGDGVNPVAALLLLTAVPVAVVAMTAVTGVGLARQASGAAAVAVGLLLTLLPALGLASLFRGGTRALGAALWLWSLAVLLCLPRYFPGERIEATARGLRFLAAPMGPRSAEQLSRLGAGVVGLLGAEPERLTEAARLSPAEGPETGAGLARRQTPAFAGPSGGVTVLPFEGDGASLRVSAFFDGPVYGEEFAMIFDTGATYTTLNREALEALEVDVPPDAPRVTLHTAGGESVVPLVLLDGAWLGDEMVDWVTVAVCEPCAGDGVAGLLGLNVTGQFEVALLHDRRQIELRRLPRRAERQLDLRAWLTLESRLRYWRDGRLEIELKGSNRSRAGIERALVEVECPGGRFGVELEAIPARAGVTTRMSLPRDTDCTSYQIEVLGGIWEGADF
jgi:hypothetical protein